MWSSENAVSILDFVGELELWTRAGKIKKAGGRPATRHADRHVRTGGVGQPETTARPTTVSIAHRKHAQGTVRTGVDKRGCGTCPLNARHVPELF